MPDKSKRRRNNKNKRKNKNNRSETCPNESVRTELLSEKLEEQICELECENQNNEPNPENIQRNIVSENLENAQEVSQDLNNNNNTDRGSDNIIPLNEEFISTKLSLALDSSSSQDVFAYVVEVPEQRVKNKSKLINTVKSKSLDNDDAPKIVEITDDNSSHIEESNVNPIIDYSNVVIYDTDTDVEWENIDEFQSSIPMSKQVAKEIVSITTLPLDVAHCEETKTLTPEEEVSLRNYLKTLQLSTTPDNIHSLEIKSTIEQIVNQEVKHRLRKKGSADDFFIQRLGPPRVLDVIDEEVSGESSATSRRQSYLSDKKSDIEDLEDDVFESKSTIKDKFATKSISSLRNKPLGHLVQQECLLVGAKLKEPEVSEARGDWTMKTIERMTGAEVVYLTDSSSSTSSLHEIEEDTDDGIETDVSIRMVTPTIEVTDTENLLKKTFLTTKDDNSKSGSNSLGHDVKVDSSSITDSRDPKEVLHEIVVLSTDDIKTNLYVKELDECINNDFKIKNDSEIKAKNTDFVGDKNAAQKSNKTFDLEIKVIKCELNDAFNNLIKEVTSDSESTPEDNRDIKENIKNDNYTRQDSSSSVSSSQCTAKYNPTYSSLNDVSNIQQDEPCENVVLDADNVHSHVKDVIDCITRSKEEKRSKFWCNMKQPCTLKDFCITKIASLPYGDKILEELASVSARLQNIPSSTESITNLVETSQSRKDNISNYYLDPVLSSEKTSVSTQAKDNIPPPVKPRYSSLKRSQDEEHRIGVSNNTEPVYVCLSPSQKMLIEKTNTDLSRDDNFDLVNIPNKFDDPKGHYETYGGGMTKTRRKSDDLPEISPVTPLKSQTGSRLLALLCDPSISANVDSLKNRYHNSSEQLDKDYVRTENILANKIDINNVNRDFSRTLRPIVSPKPKTISTSIFERDESSDFMDNSFRSVRNEKKIFHFSTGNLNKEIENDISSIQDLHRFHTDVRHNFSSYNVPRRPSLPKDLCDQQMEYIRRKEKEVDAEIQRLQEMKNSFSKAAQRKGPRAPLITEKDLVNEDIKNTNNYFTSQTRDIVTSRHGREGENHEKNLKSSLFYKQEELQREKMFSEFATQMAEREERKQQKVIKITKPSATLKTISKSLSALDVDSKVNNRIEKEFISRARERWEKLGIKDPETEDERECDKNVYNEPKIIEHKIKVIEDGKEKDVQRLPSHLQEFVRFTAKGSAEETDNSAVWRPGAPSPPPTPAVARSPGAPPPPPPPPVWVPGSAGASPQATRKTFRPVHFEETPPSRRKFGNSEQNGGTSGSESEGRLKTSHSAPVTGFNTLGSPSVSSRLPRAPNPTVTLLQKAREGHIPRGTSYLQSEKDSARLPRDRPSPPKGDPVHALRKEYASESEVERSDYERGGIRKMADAHKKVEGIGPTTKDGIPVALRSEVKDPSRWYKKMYDTIHKNKYDDDYVTIRYKNRRGHPQRVSSNKSQYAYFDPRSGYLSEPEGGLGRLGSSTWSDAYDSDVATGPRRRTASVQEDRRTDITTSYLPSNKYSTLASARASQEMYKNQPGRIEDYVPGRSSVIDKEAKQQNITSTTSLPQASPKEKKDITSAILSKSNMAKALKESGYESDSTLIFRRREDTEAPLSPAERRAAYRDLQAGGEPPLRGFRSPAPPRQESPRRYVESDVNIHYRCPVRHDPLPLVPERELARQQAEHMKRLYREQRRTKYLQELQDMQNRRHQDNFTPSQKTVVPLNRYDEADKVTAKALYTFNGQTPRELSFRKGEIIHVRRQIDANWYEGEVHGKIGLFPYNYVELQKSDTVQAPKKTTTIEGRARAKFDFIAQTNLELPLKKGEVVILTRRIDQNWWEGRNGVKTGIFPDSYVTVLQEPTHSKPEPKPILSTDKPVASPAAHGLLNGTDKRSMGSHSYTPQPNSPALANAPPATQPLPGYVAKPAQATLTPSDRGYGPPTGAGVDLNNAEPLYVDTNAEAVPYRAMYKYRPQNPDELELQEGDTVYVLEKCDDGWYVGSSQRTGRFGTFPGNYVERI